MTTVKNKIFVATAIIMEKTLNSAKKRLNLQDTVREPQSDQSTLGES
jgi:hypothetical protein